MALILALLINLFIYVFIYLFIYLLVKAATGQSSQVKSNCSQVTMTNKYTFNAGNK